MPSRFTSNVLLAAVGAFLVAASLAFTTSDVAWIALASGAVAFVVTAVGFATLARGAAQRGLDALIAVLAVWTIVASRVFDGALLKWLVFGSGCGLAALAVLGLVLHEREVQKAIRAQHAVNSNSNGNGNGRAAGPVMPNAELDADAIQRTGWLSGSYWSAALLVVFALVPYLVLATTVGAVGAKIAKDVGLSEQGISLADGLSNAAYAASTVIALQLTVHLRGRRLLVLYALFFVLGSVAAAWAPTPGFFIAGRIVQGATTGLMLIAAVPPLVIGWPPARLKTTAMVMNMGIFGAVAAGPVIGGAVASAGGEAWRTLFWIVTGLGAGAFALSLLTFRDQAPQDPSAPWSPGALILATVGCGLTFFGSSELTTHRFVSTWVMLPLLAGIATILLLVVNQYLSDHPLMPVKRLTSTFPVVGILVAICAGASSIAVTALVEAALLAKGASPGHVGTLFWPQFGGAVLAALIFGLLFSTKWTKVIAITGLLCVAGGAAVLTGVSTHGDGIVWIGSSLLGFGVGASVAPALFVAGFSLPSNNIARIFALIELMRAVAAFSIAPILTHISLTTGGSPVVGTRTALWICFGIAAGGTLLAVYLFVLARAKPHHPNIDRWIGGTEPAFDSPALAAALRGLDSDPHEGSDFPGHVHAARPVPERITS